MLALPLAKDCSNYDKNREQMRIFLQNQFKKLNISLESGSLDDIDTFLNIRSKAVNITELNESACNNYLNYNYHVAAIAVRFDGYESEMNVKYVWNDAFTHRSISTGNILLDQGCVLWNIAALHTLDACKINRSTDEGSKSASRLYQQSAGLFHFIKQNIISKINKDVNCYLCESIVDYSIKLCLAQALLCIYEKSVRDRKVHNTVKPSLLAKLAMKTSISFAEAEQSGMKNPSLDKSWYVHCRFQSKMFRGAAEYWQSISSKDLALSKGSGYGEEVTRLFVAEKILLDAIQEGKKLGVYDNVLCGAESLVNSIKIMKESANKDLMTVYLELPTPEGDLQPIKSLDASMVEPLSLPSYDCNERKLFKDIVPKSVQLVNDSIREYTTNAYKQYVSICGDLTNLARTTLASVGLPGSLQLYLTGGEFPDDLFQKFKKIQNLGGVNELISKRNELNNISMKVSNIFSSINESIKSETETDSLFRSRNHEYKGLPFTSANNDIIIFLDKIQSDLSAEQSKWRFIDEKLNDPTIIHDLSSLTVKSKEELKAILPNPNQDNIRKLLTYDSSQLEKLLNEMATIIDTRTKKLDALVEISNKDYIGMILNNNTAGNDANKLLSDVKLACGSIIDELNNINIRQPNLLTEIVNENSIFKEKSTNDECIVERNAIIINMESLVTKYNNLHSLLSISYGATLSLYNKCVQLLQTVTERVSQQSFKRQEFEMNIINGVSNVATAPYPVTSTISLTDSISTLDINPAGSPRNKLVNTQTSLESKANRLSEMGFNHNDCIQALLANNEDEEMALNSLLAGSPSNVNTSTINIAPPPVPPSKPSIFSWGSSKK